MSKPFRGDRWECDPSMPVGLIVILQMPGGDFELAMVTSRGAVTVLQKGNQAHGGGWLLPEHLRHAVGEARA